MPSLALAGRFIAAHARTRYSRQHMSRLQDRMLRRLLNHAWDHSPYYRERFAAAGISRADLATIELHRLPTIDKQELMQHFDTLVTDPALKLDDLRAFDADESDPASTYLGRYHVVHSSGSTGKPGYFVYDDCAWNRMLAAITRGALWNRSLPWVVRFLFRRPRVAFIAATDGRYGGVMAVGDGVSDLGLEQISLDINMPLEQWIVHINVFKPTVIIGYPSAIKILMRMVDEGHIHISPERIISCGEPMDPGLRAQITNTFGCAVINFYGASESLALGVESDPTDGMVLFDDMNLIEVDDGQMYLTSLTNYTQPLIRYRISDRLQLIDSERAAARFDGVSLADPSLTNRQYPFTRSHVLLSRNEDMLWFDDGRGGREFLHPLAIEGFCVEGLLDYQFAKTGDKAFTMVAERRAQADENNIRTQVDEQMRQILHSKRLDHIAFDIIFVDHIMPDPRTGKKRLVVTCHCDASTMGKAV
ncbi:phenylacetate--CoA ligase family protein [Bifidobacterium oedipodis]|uniref:Coenzyme F390 synthetase n=1 Tax=Bifidobacterium oedipodis TaxID=2675322 RepID=A0A7Y0EQA6_9BIFI|nr:phenylacetate--CoA ligase family protein [Bifidobacterium sp. DSM 109957]NMM94417.1 coenzyme F390 synthetase [Bifidobacterium sp. DSM 109957]